MKFFRFKSCVALLVLSVFMCSGVRAYAYDGVPEKVRIGLCFNDAETKQYSAAASFEIDSAKGLQIGCYKDNVFSVLTEEVTPNAITVRKDAFFSKSGGKLTEYNPATGKAPDGEKIGAYHIKIGGDYSDLKSLGNKLSQVKQKGIAAYPVYSDKWEIWTGFYLSEDDAKKSILYSLDPTLGKDDYNIVPPSPTRIVAGSKNGEVMLMFDSNKGAFQLRPNPKASPMVFRLDNDDKKRYRGELEVKRLSGSDMTLVNVVPMDQYLYGVVPYEIGAGSHPEALKAQAVSARTYTINNLSKYARLGFNLCTTTYSQVYKGINGETAATNKAVDDTKGKIVTYKGKPAAVFYFSSSGGRTEDVKNVWGSEDYPYLVSVEDKYESGNSWHYNWEVTYTAQKLKQIMTERGFKLGDIKSVEITKRSEAGRAIEIVVRGASDERTYKNGATRSFLSLDSQWYDITSDADVSMIGSDEEIRKIQLAGKKVATAQGVKEVSNSAKSAIIISSSKEEKKVPFVPTVYTFTGKGWGHGVGMSQEGAKGMANNGYDYEQILKHYFTGTKVE
ncbi:MAG: SpoIID/LytB domain-containing protein [Clostridiaceae bacterium]|nr:SpoIID/LytB domain-containing protein [Clostridiaceae bacterium]